MARLSRKTKVGLLSVLGIVIVALLVFASGYYWPKRKGTVQLNVIFEYVSHGLERDVPVEMDGTKIGRVLEVRRMNGNRMVVSIVVEPKHVRSGDEAQINTMGLLGDAYIRIVPSMVRDDFASPGMTIKGQAAMRNKELEQLIEKLG